MIRRAGPADLDAIAALEEGGFVADRFRKRTLRRLLKSPTAAFLLAEAEGAALGYALLLFRRGSTVARLYSIAAAHAARGQGVGAALLAGAEALARERGADRLRLEVRASNTAAIALYSRTGFSILKESPGYYPDGESALKMEKRLIAREGPTP